MSVLTFTLKHGRSLPEAREQLERAVSQVQSQFGAFVSRTEWSADRNGVTLSGTGFVVEMRVDPVEVHVTGDIPLLGNLLGNPLTAGLKKIVQQAFPKSLPSPGKPQGGS
jgi:hypothetical protein